MKKMKANQFFFPPIVSLNNVKRLSHRNQPALHQQVATAATEKTPWTLADSGAAPKRNNDFNLASQRATQLVAAHTRRWRELIICTPRPESGSSGSLFRRASVGRGRGREAGRRGGITALAEASLKQGALM